MHTPIIDDLRNEAYHMILFIRKAFISISLSIDSFDSKLRKYPTKKKFNSFGLNFFNLKKAHNKIFRNKNQYIGLKNNFNAIFLTLITNKSLILS